jgi:predicted Ser/Thr protein kinase
VQVGALIDDKYQVESTLGVGGFGAVYSAVQKQFDRKVAIKTLNTTLLLEPDGVARFEREAKAINALKHKNIIGFYGYGVSNQTPYMVMELVEGISLDKLLIKETKIEPMRALRLMKQVFEALACAHASGIVHRDLKPPNILVAKDPDGSETIKIIDFGLAKLMPGYGIPGQKLTETGYSLGTCNYMPPEQALGIAVDQRADIYSAGCIFFEMLTGGRPFVADDNVAIMFQHINEAPRPLSDFLQPPAPVDALNAFLANCMAKEKEDRYQTCGDAILDLDKLAQGKFSAVTPLAVRPMKASRKVHKAGQRKVLSLVATVLVLCLVAGAALAFLREQKIKDAALYRERIERSKRNIGSAYYSWTPERRAELELLLSDADEMHRLPDIAQLQVCGDLLNFRKDEPVTDANIAAACRTAHFLLAMSPKIFLGSRYQETFDANRQWAAKWVAMEQLNSSDSARLSAASQAVLLKDAATIYYALPPDYGRAKLRDCLDKAAGLYQLDPVGVGPNLSEIAFRSRHSEHTQRVLSRLVTPHLGEKNRDEYFYRLKDQLAQMYLLNGNYADAERFVSYVGTMGEIQFARGKFDTARKLFENIKASAWLSRIAIEEKQYSSAYKYAVRAQNECDEHQKEVGGQPLTLMSASLLQIIAKIRAGKSNEVNKLIDNLPESLWFDDSIADRYDRKLAAEIVPASRIHRRTD